jgi:hypothetical protein
MIDYYLAVPYSDPDPKIREYRFQQVTIVAGELIKKGFIVYSPITHNHIIAEECNLKLGFDFWKKSDLTFLKMSKTLVVLELSGWKESGGVQAEIAFAMTNKINITFCKEKIYETLL